MSRRATTERPEERLPEERNVGFRLNTFFSLSGHCPGMAARTEEQKEDCATEGLFPPARRAMRQEHVFAYSAHKSRTMGAHLMLQDSYSAERTMSACLMIFSVSVSVNMRFFLSRQPVSPCRACLLYDKSKAYRSSAGVFLCFSRI
jgi:hypothetical protein